MSAWSGRSEIYHTAQIRGQAQHTRRRGPLAVAARSGRSLTFAPGHSAARTTSQRRFRTLLLLSVVTVLSLFDWAFTESQLLRGDFAEANPLAATLASNPAAVGTYKLALLCLGVSILFCLRRRWESEASLWLLLVCHAGLMVWWIAYLHLAEICVRDPAVWSPPIMF